MSRTFTGLFFVMIIKTVNGKSPLIPEDCYVAENATIVGDVLFGQSCSVWFNAVVRGDVHFIKIAIYDIHEILIFKHV